MNTSRSPPVSSAITWSVSFSVATSCGYSRSKPRRARNVNRSRSSWLVCHVLGRKNYDKPAACMADLVISIVPAGSAVAYGNNACPGRRTDLERLPHPRRRDSRATEEYA